jgi:hypothetical protein
LKWNVDMVKVVEFGFEVEVVFEVLGLPEVPRSDEDFALGFEMFFNLVENKELFFLGRKVMKNGNTKNVVELGKLVPNVIITGNISLDKLVTGVSFFGGC